MLKTSTDQRGLLANMNVIAQAPGGVARLRELILTLAVQGKLVAQDASDEPASELLKKIRAEKDRLIAEGKIKKDKPLPAITEDEKPFELPVGWEWIRISDVAYSQAGFAFKSSGFNTIGAGLPLIRIRDVGFDSPETYFSGDYRKEFLVSYGDWLISMDGEFRVRQWKGSLALLNQRVSRLIFYYSDLPSFFITTALQFELNKLQGTKAYTTVDHLSGAQISNAVIALPPLAEQSRIVARVEALMRLCDALEEKGRLEQTQHQQLLQAMLDSLTQTTDAQELARHWQRLAQHFDLLIDRPEAVDALEQTILQLAVRGLLVPQDPSDEPASELLKKIRAEKDRLIAEGKIKKDKPLPAVADDEKPFELPAGWIWGRVGNVGITKTGGTPSSSRSENFDGKFPFIGPGQITLKGEVLPPEKFISEIGCLESEIAEPNDILMVCIGGSIGKCAAVNYATAFNQQINSIHPIYALNDYVLYAMKSRDFFFAVIAAATGSATPIISKGKWDQLLLPIPPLAEQSRIVARVTELRALCQQLREKLTQARTTQTQLAQAWVEQVATI